MKKFYLKQMTAKLIAGGLMVAGSMLFSVSSSGQAIMNNTGAKINIAASTVLNIDGSFLNVTLGGNHGTITNNGDMTVSGDWTNNATSGGVFTSNAGIVYLDGAAQTIGGTNPTLFNNLSLTGTGNKTMAVDNTVGGGTSPGSGVLSLGTRTLILGTADDYDLTITNPLSTAITTTTGQIISENTANPTNSGSAGYGYSYVNWNIGQSGNGSTYIVPFGTVDGDDIAFTYQKITAGTGLTGVIKFATYHTNAQNQPWATGVTHLTNMSQVANWYDVMDRFWIIEQPNYTAKPSANLVFKYDDVGGTIDLQNGVGMNSINEAVLRAQRWNPNLGIGLWGDWLFGPYANSSANTMSITIANGPDFFDVWTLVDESNPLPIELVRFEAACNNSEVAISWTTASETNNDFFTVERSLDGINFEFVATVDGAGNSNSIINYNATDYSPYGGTSYYRLKQTDFDGGEHYSDVVAVSCADAITDFNLINAYDQDNGTIAVVFNAGDNEPYTVTLFDALGRQITETTGKSYSGKNQITINTGDLARGIYLVNLRNEFKSFGRRVMLH